MFTFRKCFLWLFIITISLTLIQSQAAQVNTPKRFAMVIGNSNYVGAGNLDGIPENDAIDLTKTLETLGFKTTTLINVNRSEMLKGLNTFKKDLKQNPGSIAVYYFAGHGVQLDGTNYLLPLNGDYEREENVQDEAVTTSLILERIQAGEPSVSLVILDACRNNPYEGIWRGGNNRSIQQAGRGLAKIFAPSGFLIAYSTQPGQVASNGVDGRNGLYTSALLKHLPTNDIDVYEVFNRVRAEVEQSSKRFGKFQSPREDTGLLGERLYLMSKPKVLSKQEQNMFRLMNALTKGDISVIKELELLPVFQILLKHKNQDSLGSSDTQMATIAIATEQVSTDPRQKALAQAMQIYLSNGNNIDLLKKASESGNVFAGMMLERSYRLGAASAPKKPHTAKMYEVQKDEAYMYLQALIDKGDDIALSWLANRYRDSEDKEDHKKAFELFSTAAEKGMVYAQGVLGHFYGRGKGTSKNEKKSFNWIQKAAESGFAWSQRSLGDIYKNGEGVVQNYKLAMHWYEKAKEQGDEDAYVSIGYLHEKGFGVEQDYKAAVDWYRKGAEAGSNWGQRNMGIMYSDGKGLKQDYQQAMKWYEKAKEQGDEDAYISIGYLYEKGFGVKQDYKAAVDWYRKAAEAGNKTGYKNLGVMYRDGKGVKKDVQKAIKWFEKAANAGDTNLMEELGHIYNYGKGINKNFKKAISWYKKAINNGNYNPTFELGYMYAKGNGVKQNDSTAVEWYRKGANKGVSWAQKNLGFMYRVGRGVKQDYKQALTWFKKAAKQNNKSAFSNIGFLYERGYGVEQSDDLAVSWYLKGAKAGDGWGMLNLGSLYRYGGMTLAPDLVKSVKWYSKAAKVGYDGAADARDRTISEVKEMQRMLKMTGFYTGKVDGLAGKKTMQAYKKWSAENGGGMVAGGEMVAGGGQDSTIICHEHEASKLTKITQHCHKNPKGQHH